jgi:hypothetical protein
LYSRPQVVEKAKQFRAFAEFIALGYYPNLAAPLRALDLRLESRQVEVELIWDEPV